MRTILLLGKWPNIPFNTLEIKIMILIPPLLTQNKYFCCSIKVPSDATITLTFPSDYDFSTNVPTCASVSVDSATVSGYS